MPILTELNPPEFLDLTPAAATDVTAEATGLCQIAVRHVETLRAAASKRRITIEGAEFKLLHVDRNRIFRVKRSNIWYLKIPRAGDLDPMRREVRGYQAIAQLPVDFSDYVQPAAVCACLTPAMLLVAEIPGQPLHRAIYRSAFLFGRKRREAVERGMRSLGHTMARLHQCVAEPGTPAANRLMRAVLPFRLSGAAPLDATGEKIEAWFATLPVVSGSSAFLHGNLKQENILYWNEKISLIDFENSGIGDPMEDLSWPMSQLLLTECVWKFPHSAARRALRSLQESYADLALCDPESLTQNITLRIARYYLEMYAGNFGWPRIAGLPVSVARLRRLLDDLLHGASWEETIKRKE